MNEFIPLSISFPQFSADYSRLNSKWQGEITFAQSNTKNKISYKNQIDSGTLQIFVLWGSAGLPRSQKQKYRRIYTSSI